MTESTESTAHLISQLSLNKDDFNVIEPAEVIEKSSHLTANELTALQRHRHAVAEYLKLHHETVPEFQDVTFLPGHVNNLSPVEEVKLQLLWFMMLAVLSGSFEDADLNGFDSRTGKQKAAVVKRLFARLFPLLPPGTFNEAGQELDGDFYDFSVSSASLYQNFFSCSSASELAARVEANPLSSEFYDQIGAEDPDTLLLRFLRARKWILLDATVMLLDTLYWHKSFGVGKLMREGEPAVLEYLLTCGKHYAWNVDHKGRLVIWITSRLHDKNRQTLQQNLEALVYLVEQARRMMAPGTETVSLVFDLADAPYSSLDLPSIQGDIHVLQNYYPECLGACYVVDAPWIFHGLYRIVKGFLDPAVVAKVNLIDSEELVKFIHPSMVPKRYQGGCDGVEYVHSIDSECSKKRINPVPDLEALESEVKALRRRLIQMTIEQKSCVAFDPEGERAVVRADLEEASLRLENASLPPTHHHRCGVLSRDGKVNWREKRSI